jgi:hypothetical protein
MYVYNDRQPRHAHCGPCNMCTRPDALPAFPVEMTMCRMQLDADWSPFIRDGDITGGSAHFPANLIRTYAVTLSITRPQVRGNVRYIRFGIKRVPASVMHRRSTLRSHFKVLFMTLTITNSWSFRQVIYLSHVVGNSWKIDCLVCTHCNSIVSSVAPFPLTTDLSIPFASTHSPNSIFR